MNYEWQSALDVRPEVWPVLLRALITRSKIKVFEITQKTLIKELDKLSAKMRTTPTFTLGSQDQPHRVSKMNDGIQHPPLSPQKGSDEEIKAAWSAAQENRDTICSNSW